MYDLYTVSDFTNLIEQQQMIHEKWKFFITSKLKHKQILLVFHMIKLKKKNFSENLGKGKFAVIFAFV